MGSETNEPDAMRKGRRIDHAELASSEETTMVFLTSELPLSQVICKFADGTEAEADFVVGCDGIRSCRPLIYLKDSPP